ncbi:MAG TPA: hypothetical protein VMG10_21860 [Gemmataceae bacterium]|nr:hypothetical protein [Gemmataceae bacterium]
MGSSVPPRNGEPQQSTIGDHRAWWLVLLALVAWQSWMTLMLFGGAQPWKSLLDDRPILSGRHPLHLYHGYLGALALRENGNLSCYDPTFHAGYPKTPVFDSGSRPAELVLAVAGGHYCPAAYKIGLTLVCAAVPLILFLAARSAELKRAAACLACLLGLLVWWGQPCREILESGDIDVLLATLLVLAQAGMLIRYHDDPGPFSWLGVVGAALLGWFAHPLLLALMLPLFLVYYLSVGTRHRLAWHLALLSGLLAALGINSFWLIDWVRYWWIRVPPHSSGTGVSPVGLLAEPTLRSVWESSFWGGPFEKGLTCFLVLAAAFGVLLYHRSGQRAAARLLGLSWAGFLALSVGGLTWEPLRRFGAPRLLVPALLFAVLPAAHALTLACASVRRRRAIFWTGLAATAAGAALLWHAPPPALASWATRLLRPSALQLGLDADQQAILDAVREHTTSEARILWEDRVTQPLSPHWTPLLTLLTERAYIGGLDAEAGIEHTTNGLTDAVLMGRPIRDWSDDALEEYCTRYNIGWVACWSAAACERLRDWPRARRLATLPPPAPGEPPGGLFAVRRSRYSFALIGSARWLAADPQRIILGDVTPTRGEADNHGKKQILLSLHYQAGMRVAPSRVVLDSYSIERANSMPGDSRPFVRLWVEEPVTRVTITWDKR